MNAVLIAHYDKDLSWVEEITAKVDIRIYSTGDPSKTFITPNKGMDANMYLRYIIDNYNNLPERTLFVHHHREDWTQDFPLPVYINNLNWELCDYFNIGARKNYWDIFKLDPRSRQWLRSAWFIFEDKIPYPEELYYYAGTQFMAHRKLFLQYPKSYWESLHGWLMTSEMSDWLSGRIFEYTWHYLLTHDNIDKRFENHEIINGLIWVNCLKAYLRKQIRRCRKRLQGYSFRSIH